MLTRREERIERRLLRHVTKPPPVPNRVVRHVASGEEDGSAGRLHQARQHAAGCRLPGAVRAEIADHFSRMHGEAHIVHDRDPVEPLDQVTCLEKGDETYMDLAHSAGTRRRGRHAG